MKPRLFIGCSAEKITIAESLQDKLKDIADCIIWHQGVFKNNVSFLDTLLKEKVISNYGLFIATNDDLLQTRDDIFAVTRDNIIFEFALFLGALGRNRAILLVEEHVKLPSDMSGIKVHNFSLDPKHRLNLDVACQQIKENIKEAEMIEDFSLLPSTSLAIGYYNNFVKRICEDILSGANVSTPKNRTV